MRIIRQIILGCAAFPLVMVALELFLRFSATSTPSFVMNDPRLGIVFRPNTNFVYFTEGFYIGGTNAYGYLGPGYPPQKPEGTLRVALVGDSFIEGFQLFDRDHIRNVLEKNLSEAGVDAEVMNFGFSGFNFTKMSYYCREVVMGYSPDVVLIFIGEDDLDTQSSGLEPRFYVEGDSLRVDLSFAESSAFRNRVRWRFVRRLALYGLVRTAYNRYKKGNYGDVVFGKFASLYKPRAAHATGGSADRYRDVNMATIRMLAGLERNGTRFAIVEKRPVDRTYRDAFTTAGIPVLDLAPTLSHLREAGIRPDYWPATNVEGHWNRDAHHAIGRFLVKPVLELSGRGDGL